MNFLSNVSQMIIQTTNWYVFGKKFYYNANDAFEIKLTEQVTKCVMIYVEEKEST